MIIVFIIVILGITLLVLKTDHNKKDYYDNSEYLEEGGEIISEIDKDGFADVKDNNIFFSIFNSVERYIDILQYDILDLDENHFDKEGNYVEFDENKLYLLDIKNDNDRLKAIIDLLDKDYVDSNKITLNNIQQYVDDVTNYSELIPISMKVKYGDNINTYILNAYLKSDKLIQKKSVVKVNNKNETFSIQFISDNVYIEETQDEIKKNKFNHFKIEEMDDGKIISKYLDYFKKITLEYPQIVYENYLEEEYREKRFGSLENYKNYINDNIEELKYIQIIKYFSDITKDNNIYYVGIDQYENTYIFTTSASMQYKLKLDNYTIPTDTFKKEYKESNNENKVKMNVDKFIKMINRQDFRTSYSCLADSFKNNYFKTEEEFKQYVKSNFFLYNNITYNNLTEESEDLYSCELNLIDLTNKSYEIKKISIVMKLEDDMNFKMSFSIE